MKGDTINIDDVKKICKDVITKKSNEVVEQEVRKWFDEKYFNRVFDEG